MIPAPIRQALAAARRRVAAVGLARVLPVACAAIAVAWRADGSASATIVALVAGLGLAAWLAVRLRRVDAAWAVRRLDQRRELEDSSDLLLADPARLGPLQQLQRARIEARLRERPADLRPAWPVRAAVASSVASAAVIALALLWPAPRPMTAPAPERSAADETTSVDARLVEATLTVTPPAYTRLPASQSSELSARAPAGSRLAWRLRFEGEVTAVSLQAHDGQVIALTPEDGAWTGGHVLDRSLLYRLVVDAPRPPAPSPLHRLEAVPDQAPEIRTLAPERNLTLHAEGQRAWPLRFEARDDHGLGPARLVVTLAQGSGEQVTVSERTIALRGEGESTSRRYAHALDLAAAGFAEGDDLIVRLEVADNRAPSPQWSRSASFILRWPPPASAEATGMEGLVQRALPAYFRSQRQIIIDAEALVAQRRALAADVFTAKSDAIGVDQRILRLRYGQFLGEEDEPGPTAPPTGDHDEDAHAEGDGHDHAGEAPAPMGGGVDVLEDFGHTHDDAEAATLLDPETRALLKKALDAMWSSEGELRQGQPERALPHAYRALEHIKQVQNATRIYLARVGLELPPVDEARRLTGKREGIASRRDGLVPAEPAQAPALALWQALGDPAATPDLAAVDAWLQSREEDERTLDVVEALALYRADPACGDCRDRLRARLWPLLPAAVPAAGARAAADDAGRAYLRALESAEATR